MDTTTDHPLRSFNIDCFEFCKLLDGYTPGFPGCEQYDKIVKFVHAAVLKRRFAGTGAGPLDQLRATVAAMMTVWDHLELLEQHLAPTGATLTDRAHDELHDLLVDLATGRADLALIDASTLAEAVEIAALPAYPANH